MNLYDYNTAKKIGAATPEQERASLDAGDTGVIVIDAEGRVIEPGGYGEARGRRVYVAV